MSSMFSSPSKQAQTAANNENAISSQDITTGIKYVDKADAQLRGAIPSGSSNPYLNAGATMSPQSYAVNPSYTASFQAPPPPGLTTGQTTTPANAAAGVPASSGNPFVRPTQQPMQRNA